MSVQRAICTWLVLSLAACSGNIDAAPYPGARGSAGTSATPGAPGSPNAPAAAGGAAAASANTPVDCNANPHAPRRIWRLTPQQYDNTIKDLFGTDSKYGQGFPADDIGTGFSNAADALLMTPLLADKLQSAADDISAAADLTHFASCAGGAKDDNCLRELVTRFGERAFRRPLTASEIDRYTTLAKAPGAFDAGARLAISAMLQSPYFLYRFELGAPSKRDPAVYELDDYEIASELSYMLWQTMPDDALLTAAKSGQLHDPAQLAMHVDRMLKSERARPVVRGFVFDWLGLSTILTVPKDTARYPELTPEIRAAMVDEAEKFVDHVMFDGGQDGNGSIAALLNSKTTYLNDALAKFYGVSSAAPGSGVTLEAQQRRGILTLGGVMLTHSRSNDSSPIHRGKMIRERLLCQPLPPPPPGLVLQPPGLDPNKTTRERYADHASNAYCASCHKLMDPIGLAFEHFDGIGRFRADDNGLAIDVSGQILPNESHMPAASDADGDFMGTDGLIDKLDASADVERCYALSWFRFAYGEGKTERDGAAFPSCQAKQFQSAAVATGGTLLELMHALTQADWFTVRASPPPGTVVSREDAEPVVPPPAASNPTAPAANGSSMPPAANVPAELQVMRTVDNDWGMGYCYTYQLKNTGTAPITWSVPLDVRGKMNNHWECNVSGDSGMVTFTGADHNKTIDPGGMAQFGFCGTTS